MNTLRRIIIISLMSASLFAQPREGKTRELSISGSFQNFSSGSGSGSSSAVLISPRLGFYVFRGLEIEPEIICMFGSGGDPVYVMSGNISYNFISHGKGVPFILVGYGIANTIPMFGVPFSPTGFRIDVLNAGAGVKAYLMEDVALRLEYRFQKFMGDGASINYGYYSVSQHVDTRIHTVQFGFSVLL
jgi:hypothetical protein